MPATAELIGATVALVGLGILTLCSVRSITRRRRRRCSPTANRTRERGTAHAVPAPNRPCVALGVGLRP